MSPRPVWVVSAATQHGPIRSRPDADDTLAPLEKMLVDAAHGATRDIDDARIDAIHVATMGIRVPGDGGRMHVGHLGPWLPASIGLSNPDLRVFTWLDTSDSGAAALQRAIADVAASRANTALVVAGEQMFATGVTHPDDDRADHHHAVLDLFTGAFVPAHLAEVATQLRKAAAPAIARGESLDPAALLAMIPRHLRAALYTAHRNHRDRAAMQEAIRGVLAPSDAAHGITMIHVGDLLMDAIARRSGLPRDVWSEALAAVAVRKNRDALAWPRGYMPAVARRDGRGVDADAYAREPLVTPWFRRLDVGAPANAAVAVVLTSDRDVADALSRGRPVLRVVASSEGHAPHALTDRNGLDGLLGSFVKAWRGLTSADSAARLLPGRDGSSAWMHDAFGSIELAWLAVAARAAHAGPVEEEFWQNEVVDRYLSGYSNPVGGLCAHGHALGASGLLQVAQALHVAQRDPHYIDTDHLPPGAAGVAPGRRVVTTSVGAALTHARAIAFDVAEDATAAVESPPASAASFAPRSLEADAPDALIGSTRGRLGSVTLLRDGDRMRWHRGAP